MITLSLLLLALILTRALFRAACLAIMLTLTALFPATLAIACIFALFCIELSR